MDISWCLFLSLLQCLLIVLSEGSNCTVNFLSKETIISLTSSAGGNDGGPSGLMKKKIHAHMVTKSKQQSLFPLNWFNCSGNLTQWIFAGKFNGANKPFHPALQIWRPQASPAGSFSKVSETIVQVTGAQTSGVYTYNLATPLHVKVGDRLGLHHPDKKKSSIEIYIYDDVPKEYQYFTVEKTEDPLSYIETNNNHDVKTKHGVPVVAAVVVPFPLSSSVTLMSTTTSTRVLPSSSSRATSSTHLSSLTYAPSSFSSISSSAPSPSSYSTYSSSTHSLSSSSPSPSPSPSLSPSPPPSLSPSPPPSLSSFLLPTISSHTRTNQSTPRPASLTTSQMTMTKRVTPDAGVSKTIQEVRSGLFTRTSSNAPDNTNTHDYDITFTQSSSHTSTPLSRTSTTTPIRILPSSSSSGTSSIDILPSSSSSSPAVSTNAGSSKGHSGSLLPIIIGSAVGAVGILIGICIGLLFVIVWLVKRRSLASTSNFGAAHRTCTPNRYIRKCVSSPLYEGTNLAKTTRAIPTTVIPLANSSQTSSLDSNHSSHSVSAHRVVCPRIIPPTAPPPPPPRNFSSPPLSPRTPHQGPPRVPPVSYMSPLSVSSQYSLSRPPHPPSPPPPPSPPLPSLPSTLTIPVEGNTPTSPATVGSPYEMPIICDAASSSFVNLNESIYVPNEEQRSKLFNGSVGYEFDDKLYKSLYDVQNVKDDGGESEEENKFFQESSEYWKPQKTATAIYRQLASKRYREIPRHAIQITKYLGSGQFATVNKAQWVTRGGDVSVAVKMLKTGSSEQEKVKFLQEAAINGQFHHLNVVRLLGVVTVGEPVIIVLELLGNGNLKKFLTSKRPVRGSEVPEELPNLLCNFSKQIASGMEYLAKKTFIHRDLAARNILVSEQLICKVADFGMSRDLVENEYYISQGGLVPIKWTAPEAIFYRKFSTASDVWSYGVLLFEIWSLGGKPFPSLTNEKYIEKIDEGERLAPPPGCPRSFYQLMMDCWHPSPCDRPSFTSLCQYLSQPTESLLQLGISQVELEESPEASALGAPIEAGQALFKDIQIRYLD